MRRFPMVLALATLLLSLMSPAANAAATYTLSGGGSASPNDLKNAFDWTQQQFQDRGAGVTFSLTGSVSVVLTCEKENPRKTLTKERVSTVVLDGTAVPATITYAGPNVSGYTLQAVTVGPFDLECAGARGGWMTLDAEVVSDVDLLAWWNGTSTVLVSEVGLGIS